jgi:hypothetical protein
MPHYFFHVRDRGQLIEDTDGVPLSGPVSARLEWGRIIRSILSEEQWRESITEDREFLVANELGQIILVVPFVETDGIRRR